MSRIISIIMLIAVSIGIASMVEIYKANASPEEKTAHLVSLGFPHDISHSLVTSCKKTAKNPVRCIKLGASILSAESSKGTRCYNNNCVGMNDGGVSYKTKAQGIETWVAKYNKFWYNQTSPSSFYRNDGVAPVTHYCMGKKRDGRCPEGTKNSWNAFNSIKF